MAATALEIFAGCGGAALGLQRAGWHHLACVERDPAAAATLRAAGLPTVEADVRELDWGSWAGKVDLLWASPPCQAGSTAGKRKGQHDDRDGWPWTFDAIDALRPAWLLAENVRGWTFHRPGCSRRGEDPSCVGCYWEDVVLPGVRARFRFAGVWPMDAADYGVPQHRRRVILWAGPASLDDASPPPTHGDPAALRRGLQPWVTLGHAVGDTLNRASCDRRRCYPCSPGYGRACKEPWRLDRPAPTVTTTEEKGTRAHAPGWDFHGGPDRASDTAFLAAGIRRIDIEEGLVLQGFPANWPLQGTKHQRYAQVGNAVPPALAQACGRAVLAAHQVLQTVAGPEHRASHRAPAAHPRRAEHTGRATMTEQELVHSLADHLETTLHSDIQRGQVPRSVRSWRGVAQHVELSDYGLEHPAWTTAEDGDVFLRRQEAAMGIVAKRRGWAATSPPCACCSTATREALRTPGLLDPPKASGRIRVDRAALRRALGSPAETVEAMERKQAKATGQIGVNAGRIWAFMTSSLYQSGDLPVLATRETLQNSADANRAAVRARKLRADAARFDVTWAPRARALTWEDTGLGMSAEDILTKFLTLGETGKADAGDSAEAAGGFGVAKAVILGASSTFRWMMDTRDNHVTCQGPDAEVAIFEAEQPLAGTRLTIFDVADEFDETWDRARQEWVPIEDRLHELLAANDLPKLTITLNGRVVKPMFSRRGGSRIRVEGSWGEGTEVRIKAYRRSPGDRRGAYYIRLGGLFQFRLPARRSGLKADIVVDIKTSVRPGERGYPLTAARDSLQDQARWAFQDLVDEVEKENESVGRSDEDEVLDPESEHAAEREGARELAALTEQAFADPKLQAALADATGGIIDFYSELAGYAAKREPTASTAPAGTKLQPTEDGPQRTMVLPAGFQRAEPGDATTPDVAPPGESSTVSVRQLRATFEAADTVAEANGATRVLTAEVHQALDRAELGWPLSDADLGTLAAAVEQAAETSMNMGGGGLVQAATVARVFDRVQGAAPAARRRKVNPFGKLAGLRISRKRYDRGRGYRFKKGYARWIPYLAVWDATLRLVTAEAQIRRRFKPGFILDDELLGLTTSSTSGANVVYIHPDRLKQVVKAHKRRPLAIAAFLHGIAVHELTHLDDRMGEGHSESYVAAREDLGAATAHLLPAIAVLVTNLLRLPQKKGAEQKRLERLERSLARTREKAKGCKKAKAQVPELQSEIAQLRAELDQALRDSGTPQPPADQASVVLERLAAVLRARPPAGVEPAYIDRFLNTHRPALHGLVRSAMERRKGARAAGRLL